MSQPHHKGSPQTVVQADQALVSYLDTLLLEIDDGDSASLATPVKAPPTRAATLDQVVDEIEPQIETASAVVTGVESLTQAVPEWAELPFQVLLFTVSRVNLAVPLIALRGILPLQASISQLPGQPVWALGVQLNRDSKVVVVDTQRLLMPELDIAQAEQSKHTHLLLIGNGERGLSVDCLKGTVTLEKEAVRWRKVAGQRPWYAGIIMENLTVLLDVDGVVEMLAA